MTKTEPSEMQIAASWDSAWKNALGLLERVASRVAAVADSGLVQKWRDEKPFANGVDFAKRLAAEGFDEASFADAVNADVQTISDDRTPAWTKAVAELADAKSEAGDLALAAIAAPFVADVLQRADKRLQQAAARLPVGFFDPQRILADVAPALVERVLHIAGRTMILELNVARVTGALEGSTPAERFAHFIAQVCEPARRLELWCEYPVLARELHRTSERWHDALVELCERLAEDWSKLGGLFAGEAPTELAEISLGAGDTHRGGRTVAVLTFADGRKLVYKPRSLAADAGFQRLLAWCDARGFSLPIRKLEVVDRGAYGWVEFIPAAPCSDNAGVARFYRRQGSLLALVHVLYGNDVHEENLIAAGEHPVLIDLETLFVPPFPLDPNANADAAAVRAAGWSVTRVGLLPTVGMGGGLDGVDLSGLGSSEDQWTPHPMLVCENDGTDEMRLARQKVKLTGSQNVPSVAGARASAADHHEDILAGFREMYMLLAKHRAELRSPDGPLAAFAGAEIRVVVRGTQVYARMLQESYHPDFLRDGLDRDRFFERLWAEAAFRQEMIRVVGAERAEIATGDVPAFFARTDSRDLVSGAGHVIENFFDESGLEAVRNRIAALGDDDFARQEWHIRSSFGGPPALPLQLSVRGSTDAPSDYFAHAERVGQRLSDTAIRHGNEATWLGLQWGQGKSGTAIPAGVDLYEGLPGIALYLAELAAATGEKRFRTLAEASVRTIRRQLTDAPPVGIGAYAGAGGVVYTFARLGRLWDRPELWDRATELAKRIGEAAPQDPALDVIGGSAGAIGALLALHCVAPNDSVLHSALQCGDRLLATAVPQEHGHGWVVPQVSARALAGFSHGAAGAAWALAELGSRTNDERLTAASLEALAYERTQFDRTAGNWLDLRSDVESTAHRNTSMAWCHGAPGVGLGRARMLRLADDPEIRAEIRAAATAVLASDFGGGHSLCHGSLGNLDCLLSMATATHDDDLRRQASQRFSAVVADAAQHGWKFGSMHNLEVPGLLTGLAGIGYALLRFANPQTPSVLALEI